MKPVYIIQNCEIEGGGTIIDFLNENGIPFKAYHNYRGDEIPPARDALAAISLGTPISAMNYHEHEHLRRLFRFYQDAVRYDLPLIGICGGGQLLSMALGGEVKRNPVKEIGIYKVRLTDAGKEDRLFDGFDNEFTVFQWHSDTFEIPPGGVRLAEGEACKNQAFRKGNFVGLQFHLEPTREDIRVLCDKYISELEGEKLNPGKIIEDFERSAENIKRLDYKLLGGFFEHL